MTLNRIRLTRKSTPNSTHNWRPWWLVAALVAWSPHAQAALREGDTAPDFQLQAALDGKTQSFALQAALKKGPVVVYFFPTAYGGGCSVQAHAFSEGHERVQRAGATLVGISQDSIARLAEFSADPEYCSGKFPVASDPTGQVSRAYDLKATAVPEGRKDIRGVLASHDRVERSTFIVGTDGRIAKAIGGLDAKANVEQTLAALEVLKPSNGAKPANKAAAPRN